MLYAKIRLTEPIERAIPQSGWPNAWETGTEFYVRQNEPGLGMVVIGGVEAGIGVPPEAAEILETFESHLEMYQAMKAN